MGYLGGNLRKHKKKQGQRDRKEETTSRMHKGVGFLLWITSSVSLGNMYNCPLDLISKDDRPVDLSWVSFFSYTVAHWMYKVAMTLGTYARHRFFLSLRLIWLLLLFSVQYANSKGQCLALHMTSFPWGKSQTPGGKSVILESLMSGR